MKASHPFITPCDLRMSKRDFVWLQYNVDEPEQEKYNLTYT